MIQRGAAQGSFPNTGPGEVGFLLAVTDPPCEDDRVRGKHHNDYRRGVGPQTDDVCDDEYPYTDRERNRGRSKE